MNFGGDYMHQQLRKQDYENENTSCLSEAEIVKPIDNVRDSIQAGGEGEAAPTCHVRKAAKPKSKKKKEAWSETEQDCPQDC